MGWTVEQTLYTDVNAILIAFAGRVKMIRLQQGDDPFAEPRAPAAATSDKPVRRVPDAAKLPLLTPHSFDAMFPGKTAAAPILKRGTRTRGRTDGRHGQR